MYRNKYFERDPRRRYRMLWLDALCLNNCSLSFESLQFVAYDVATLPWGSEKNRYFLIMTDLFLKWVEIAPMSDQTSHSIFTTLKTFWFHRHGLPEAVLSNQEPNVDGSDISRALEALGVRKLRSSPYHADGNGQAERNIQTVKQTIRCILEDREFEKECWPSVLLQVAYTLNTLPGAGTRLSPCLERALDSHLSI